MKTVYPNRVTRISVARVMLILLDTQLKCLGVLTVHKSVRLYILAESPSKVNSTPLAQVYLGVFVGVGEISK